MPEEDELGETEFGTQSRPTELGSEQDRVTLSGVPELNATMIHGFEPETTDGESKSISTAEVKARYELQGEIARGGMGAVMRGRDTLLGRDLAIKVLLESHRNNEQVVQRFIEEAQINGQLQHPGIVPIHELGQLADQRPFFAMKLVKGLTLSELLRQRKSMEEDRGRLIGIFEQVCQTVAFAHSRGVIHRDLKPSNVMVGAFGEVQVMDWGLAKVLDAEPRSSTPQTSMPTEASEIRTIRSSGSKTPTNSESHTRVGSVIGTPAYMPPEQAMGDVDQLDERADVFGLGAILSVILTGKPPYVADTATDLVEMAARGKLDDAFARLDASGAEPELVDLAKRCLSADVSDRPRDASAVAGEVSGYLESVAQRLRQAELDRLASETQAIEERKRRRVVLALVASIVLLATLAGGGWIYVQEQQTRLAKTTAAAALKETAQQKELTQLEATAKRAAIEARNLEANLRQEAVDARRKVELTLADVYTSRGLQAADDGDPAMASMWFTSAASQAQSDPDRKLQNHMRARNWSREAIQPIAALNVDWPAEALHFQPGGSLLLVRQGNNYCLWDWQDDVLLPWLTGKEGVVAACWHPDGSSLAIAVPGGDVEIRRVPDGQVVQKVSYPGAVLLLAYNRDGSELAIASDTVRIWQAGSQQFHPQSWAHPQRVHSMFFDDDTKRLFTTDVDHQVRVYAIDDAGKSSPLFAPVLHDSNRYPTAPALVDGGRGFISITGPKELTWWDSATGQAVRKLNTTPTWGLSHVVVNPQGDRFAVGGYYGPDIWDINDLDAKPIHLDHVNYVDHIVFSSDGSLMMSASWDTAAQLWSAEDGRPIGNRLNHQVGAHRVAISDDNTLLATSQDNRLVRVWQRPSNSVRMQHIEQWGERPRISFDGKLATPGLLHESTLASPQMRPTVAVVRTDSGKAAGPEIDPPGLVLDSCICSDNESVAVVSQDQGTGWLSIWNVESGQTSFDPIRLPGIAVSVSARPGDAELAVVIAGGRLIVVDAATGVTHFERNESSLQSPGHYRERADYSPDGTRLVQLLADDRIEVMDADTGQPLFDPISPLLDGQSPCRTIAFSADSKMLATGSNGAARLWSLSDGSELCQPLKHLTDWSGMCGVCFSLDGKYLLTANTDRRARVWNWRTGKLVCPPLKHKDMVYSVAITPDGKYAVTGARGEDSGPHVWELTTGRRIAPSPISRTDDAVHAARYVTLTPDGRRLIASTGQSYSLTVIDLEALVKPPDTPVDTFRLLAEVTTSLAIENGDIDTLNIDKWHQRWSQLRESKLRYGHWEPIDLIRQRRSLAGKMTARGEVQSALAHLRGALDSLNETDLPPTERALLTAEIGIEQTRLMRMQNDREAAESVLQTNRKELEKILIAEPSHDELSDVLATLIFENATPGQQDATVFANMQTALSQANVQGKARLGAAYLMIGEHEKAIHILSTDNSRTGTGDCEQLLLLSLAQNEAKQVESAEQTYDRGIALAKERPLDPSRRRLLALAMSEVGKLSSENIHATLLDWFVDRAIIPYNEAIQRNPNSAGAYFSRGQWYAAHSQWEKAVLDLVETIRLNPRDVFTMYQITSLYANRDDLSTYHQHCKSILDQWSEIPNVILADRACLACLIHPDAVDDKSRIDKLMELVRKEAPTHQYGNWFYRGIGLHHYRNGEYEQAITACETSRRLNQEQNIAVLNAANHAIEAMAHYKLGNLEKATQSMAAVKTELGENLVFPGITPLTNFWHDWLTARLLYREAMKSNR
ncbi:protein kinase domain-containing protein [Stieleria varia]|uniref:Serine/threonine-protein kinase PknB n=1 Tax=Stieleria varia TaxID=2528005 RepID=A0A5C6B6N4_9BACT|nr:protein kinase [Stieleria varia]TWU06184.1 Serine/threonine-protein kinase PknB [Stieleria varia]